MFACLIFAQVRLIFVYVYHTFMLVNMTLVYDRLTFMFVHLTV